MFFGGKGGVGKTTCAAASAVMQAKAGGRVLAVSTDPAHSLGDALAARVGPRAAPVHLRARGRLDAIELNAPRAYRLWLRRYRRALGGAIEHGTWLDEEDVDALLNLSIPGVDELSAILEIDRLAAGGRGERYDTVIVDTAPTGHALRLLSAPDTVGAVAEALDALQESHRLVRARFQGAGGPDSTDRFIALLADQARRSRALLSDRDRVAFHWVLLPEALSVAESEDGLGALKRANVRVSEVIFNRVTPDGPPCPVCDRRRASERTVLELFVRHVAPGVAVRLVHAEVPEPRGAHALVRIARELSRPRSFRFRARTKPRAAMDRRPMVLSFSGERPLRSPHEIGQLEGATLLLFGGKGGVGKTTVAAAAALALARANRTRRFLLMSTDPAHSLADVLGIPLDDVPRAVSPGLDNLQARELDARAALLARRGRLESAFGQLAESAGADAWMTDGPGGARELIDLAPPGIDELFGILSVADLLGLPDDAEKNGSRPRQYDAVILDTAPTGHTLRLLEMPGIAREWVQVLLRMLFKYRQVAPPGVLATELVELSRSIRALQHLLHDRAAARFVLVTRPAAVVRLETGRLARELDRLKLAAPAVIVNAMTLGPNGCTRCRRIAAAERRELSTLARLLRRNRRCAVVLTPLAVPPPRGARRLTEWGASWVQYTGST